MGRRQNRRGGRGELSGEAVDQTAKRLRTVCDPTPACAAVMAD